jgi:hypothetical protein
MSAEERDRCASDWMKESLSILEKPVKDNIEKLQSIKQMWSVRRNLILGTSGPDMDNSDRNAWNDLVTNVICAHSVGIWNATLSSLHSQFSSMLNAGVDALSTTTGELPHLALRFHKSEKHQTLLKKTVRCSFLLLY